MNTIPKEDSISSFSVAENDFGEEGDILDEDFSLFSYFWTISGLILDQNRSRLDSNQMSTGLECIKIFKNDSNKTISK